MTKRFSNKAKVMYGNDALDRISFELYRNNSTRIFVLSDNVSVASGATEIIKGILDDSDANATYLEMDAEGIVSIDMVRLAYNKYAESKSEFIICVGGDDIANVAKAVKALANGCTDDISKITSLNVEDKTPLMLIPTKVKSVTYAVGITNVFDKKTQKLYRLSGKSLCPNNVIIDKRATIKLSRSIAHERIIMVMGMALVALSESKLSISARIYLYAALDCLKTPLSNNKKMLLGRSGEDIVMAMVNAGIGYTGVTKCIFSLIVLHLTIRRNVFYNDVFLALLDKYLILFTNRYKDEDINLLGKYLDEDKVFEMKDSDCRRTYVIGEFRKKINELTSTMGAVRTLSELGVEEEDKEIIVKNVVNSLGNDITISMQDDIKKLIDLAF